MEATSSGAPVNYQPTESRFPWGCLLGGCLGVFLLMLVGVGTVTIGGYYFYKGQLEKYTSAEAKELPVVEASPEDIAAIEARIEDFKDKVEQGVETEELVLTADDLNSLISKEEKLRGKVFVRISDGQVAADVSFPMDEFPGGKGRFFNGSVTVNVQLDNGVLIVTVDQAEVNGQPVPDTFMEGLRKENLAKETYKDAETAKQLARIEKIVIADDRIVLKVRPSEKVAAENAAVEGTITEGTTPEGMPVEEDTNEEDPNEDEPAGSTNSDQPSSDDSSETGAEVESVD